MTIKEAIADVLQASDHPLTTREVVDEVLGSRNVRLTGKTPQDSVTAALYVMAASPSYPGVRKVSEKGQQRAKRGSVRWTWDPA